MSVSLRVVQVAAADPVLRPLIAAHMAHSEASSPATSRHNLDLDAMTAEPGLRIWVAYIGDAPIGCAALKPLKPDTGEVKSVHVLASARGKGVARALMEELMDDARQSGVTSLYLETGPDSLAAYDGARALYESLGFTYCEPFAHYRPDPNSAFMVRPLT